MNAVWHRLRLPVPIQLALGPLDLLHSPDFTLPAALGAPTVLTVHDLAFLREPDCAYPTLRAYLQRVVPRSCRRATKVIAVSDSTRRDLLELFDLPPERVVTVLEGADAWVRAPEPARVEASLKRVGIDRPYLLSVGTLEPRKNYVRLLEAFAVLRSRGCDLRLVVAGARGWLYEPIFQALDDLSLASHVDFIRPDDGALPALYAGAEAFVYPSLYEGFGLPPLEAMACGTPVAVSNRASLPEIVNSTGVLFDPLDVEDIAGTTQRLLEDSELRRRLRTAGPQRAATFTWDRAAQETVQVYQSALHA
jgi:glycosyltransferase involved in cell wall biosynthesis